MREQILSEIRRLANTNDGQPPGYKLFFRETGLGDHLWRGKFWARWSDALVEAGYSPNAWQERLDPEAVLTGVISACRHYGRFPTQDEVQLYRKANPAIPSEQAIKRHFGRRAELIAALARRASEDSQYADIAAMLPTVAPTAREPVHRAPSRDGFVYLFKSGDFYKIGRSDDLERRIKEVGIKLPEKLTPIHSIRTDDPSGIEAYWHRRFADRRANGEWFKLSALDVSAFKKRKYQ
ncbi:MAG: GIY-YIG nuclease family protein [Phenylobacterium sp.]|nr:GIY-YIG nuclease family protein [Phenylobacterium sp.]